MKFNINLNQPKIIEFGITITQAAILDLLCVAPTWAEPVVLEDDIFYWVSRQSIVRELEAFNLKADTIQRHLKSLDEKGLIFYKKQGRKDLVKITQKGKTYIVNTQENAMSGKNPSYYVGKKSENDTNTEKNPTKHGKKSENNTEKNPTYNNTNNYHNTTNDNNINKKNKQKNFFSLGRKVKFVNLSKEYKTKLKEFIDNSGKPMSYEEFKEACKAGGYKYANFKAAYSNWMAKRVNVKKRNTLDLADEKFKNKGVKRVSV